jgi:hypothetical protein
MRIIHVPFLPDFIFPILENKKKITRRPLKMQPANFDPTSDVLHFDEGETAMRIYLQDYPCPFGEPGDLILFCVEGNPTPFHQAKVLERWIERLGNIPDDQIRLEGALSREGFFETWDAIYGETQDAAHFNPWVWAVRWA